MLKTKLPRNAYDALGLPRSATSVQIRSRFRQLVRGYQKQVSAQDLFGDERFCYWANSYLLLRSPQRREYDRRLRTSRGREQPPDLLSGLPKPKVQLLQAETALVRRKLIEALDLAKAAAKQDPKNPEAYAILGDILRERNQYDQALTMYNYAIQFDPNNRRYWQLLQEVTALREGRSLPRRLRMRDRPSALNRPPAAWGAVALTLLLVALSMVYLRMNLGEPWLFNIPTNLVYVALAQGFILGLILAGTAVIGPFEDELIYYGVAGFGVQTTPVGLFVIAPGIVFFWLAPAFYTVSAYLDEHLSLSVVICLFLCSLLTLVLGAIVPTEASKPVYTLAGNFVFFGFIWGWMFGSIRKRAFEH